MKALQLGLAGLASLLVGAASFATEPTLLGAAEAGNHEAALRLLAAGGDVNARTHDGTTALMWAAYQGDLELAQKLIKAGADVTLQNDYGVSALAEAAMLGSTPIIKALLDAKADPNARNPEGETALMLVARTGNVDAAKLLVNAGAGVNATEEWGGQSPLMWAAAQKQPEMVKFLLSKGAQVNARSITREWQRKITSEPRPKDMSKGGFTPLLFAAREGCIGCAKYLLAGGADPDLGDPENVTPLILALENMHFDFAAFLIKAGANVDKWDFRGRSPVYAATDFSTLPTSAHGDVPSGDALKGADVVKLLLDKGANPNIQLVRRTPYRNRALDRGGDTILVGGTTPLVRAAKACDVTVVRLLLEHGALANLATDEGITPLMAAAGIGNNDRTTRGRFRAETDVITTMQLLLDAGADINAQMVGEPNGATERSAGERRRNFGYAKQGRQVPSELAIPHWTALHGAAMHGWTFAVQFLADHGADLSIKDADGRTARELADGWYNIRATRATTKAEPFKDTVALFDSLVARGVSVAGATARESANN